MDRSVRPLAGEPELPPSGDGFGVPSATLGRVDRVQLLEAELRDRIVGVGQHRDSDGLRERVEGPGRDREPLRLVVEDPFPGCPLQFADLAPEQTDIRHTGVEAPDGGRCAAEKRVESEFRMEVTEPFGPAVPQLLKSRIAPGHQLSGQVSVRFVVGQRLHRARGIRLNRRHRRPLFRNAPHGCMRRSFAVGLTVVKSLLHFCLLKIYNYVLRDCCFRLPSLSHRIP